VIIHVPLNDLNTKDSLEDNLKYIKRMIKLKADVRLSKKENLNRLVLYGRKMLFCYPPNKDPGSDDYATSGFFYETPDENDCLINVFKREFEKEFDKSTPLKLDKMKNKVILDSFIGFFVRIGSWIINHKGAIISTIIGAIISVIFSAIILT
jgi:hypothetical protein